MLTNTRPGGVTARHVGPRLTRRRQDTPAVLARSGRARLMDQPLLALGAATRLVAAGQTGSSPGATLADHASCVHVHPASSWWQGGGYARFPRRLGRHRSPRSVLHANCCPKGSTTIPIVPFACVSAGDRDPSGAQEVPARCAEYCEHIPRASAARRARPERCPTRWFDTEGRSSRRCRGVRWRVEAQRKAGLTVHLAMLLSRHSSRDAGAPSRASTDNGYAATHRPVRRRASGFARRSDRLSAAQDTLRVLSRMTLLAGGGSSATASSA
jgi:hypothetical protein